MPTKEEIENENATIRADLDAARLRMSALEQLLDQDAKALDEAQIELRLLREGNGHNPGPGPLRSWEDPGLAEFARACRVPFPAASIGKLPRSTCKDCSKIKWGACTQHRYDFCQVCKAKHSSASIHLDFVGHAPITARLLDLDPAWSWEPVAWDEQGLPRIQKGQTQSVLWIRLTVRGVTRIGVGTADNGQGELHKELIGDALRNAGMRFGLALDLWSKGDLVAGFGMEEPATAAPAPVPVASESPDPGTAAPLAASEPVPAPITAPDVPASSEGQSAGLTPAELKESVVMPAFLKLRGSDAKDARAALTDKGLWPILDVPDERLDEAAGILAGIVEAAAAAGRTS